MSKTTKKGDNSNRSKGFFFLLNFLQDFRQRGPLIKSSCFNAIGKARKLIDIIIVK